MIDSLDWIDGSPRWSRADPKLAAPIINGWFRVEMRGLEAIPPASGVLLVSNHSGGALTPDPVVLAPAFYNA